MYEHAIMSTYYGYNFQNNCRFVFLCFQYVQKISFNSLKHLFLKEHRLGNNKKTIVFGHIVYITSHC